MVKRYAVAAYPIFIALVSFFVLGALYVVFSQPVNAVISWQNQNYPVSGGYFDPIIYEVMTGIWVWFPLILLVSVFLIGLVVAVELRKRNGQGSY